MRTNRFDYSYSVAWNLLLITVGCILFSLGAKGILVHHSFVSGGLFGLALLAHYSMPAISTGSVYFLLNIPMFLMGWFKISRRFFWYSLYAMVVTTVSYELMQVSFHIKSDIHAAIAAGVICGAGAGIVLRSLGSNGGLDVVAIYLYQRYNIGIGKFYFAFNFVLFSLSFLALDPDIIIDSLIMVFITSVVVEYCLSMFSQRKVVYVISDRAGEIYTRIRDELRMGATFIQGRGGYSNKEKHILMTVVNNVQLKRLEEIVFTTDDTALFIAENTFNVIGSSFSRRKVY